MLAPEIVTDSFYQFFSRQLSLWLDNRSLAVYPMRLDWIQPRAFDWQSQSKYPHPAFSLHSLIVLLDPTPHFLALVPTGIVPDQNQHPFAFFSQLPNYPFKEVGRHLAHGATFYKSQQQFICVAPQQPVAAQGQRVRVCFVLFKLKEPQRFRISPGVKLRRMKPAPPRLIFIAQHPIAVGRGELFQPFKLLFFNAYCGSGLVIQFFARFHFTPSLEMALRITSRLTSFSTSPCSNATSAANSKVQRLVGLPNWRGEECSHDCNFSHLVESSRGRTVFGRLEASSRQSRPRLSKSRITLRQVCVAQPRERAMTETRSPRELASRIWQRRRVNNERERSPNSSCFRSSVVKDRTNIGGFMPPMISQNCSYTKSLVHLH